MKDDKIFEERERLTEELGNAGIAYAKIQNKLKTIEKQIDEKEGRCGKCANCKEYSTRYEGFFKDKLCKKCRYESDYKKMRLWVRELLIGAKITKVNFLPRPIADVESIEVVNGNNKLILRNGQYGGMEQETIKLSKIMNFKFRDSSPL